MDVKSIAAKSLNAGDRIYFMDTKGFVVHKVITKVLIRQWQKGYSMEYMVDTCHNDDCPSKVKSKDSFVNVNDLKDYLFERFDKIKI